MIPESLFFSFHWDCSPWCSQKAHMKSEQQKKAVQLFDQLDRGWRAVFVVSNSLTCVPNAGSCRKVRECSTRCQDNGFACSIDVPIAPTVVCWSQDLSIFTKQHNCNNSMFWNSKCCIVQFPVSSTKIQKMKDASLVGVRNFNAQTYPWYIETWEEAHISMNCSGSEYTWYSGYYTVRSTICSLISQTLSAHASTTLTITLIDSEKLWCMKLESKNRMLKKYAIYNLANKWRNWWTLMLEHTVLQKAHFRASFFAQ
jgi:hypothetical protein